MTSRSIDQITKLYYEFARFRESLHDVNNLNNNNTFEVH